MGGLRPLPRRAGEPCRERRIGDVARDRRTGDPCRERLAGDTGLDRRGDPAGERELTLCDLPPRLFALLLAIIVYDYARYRWSDFPN